LSATLAEIEVSLYVCSFKTGAALLREPPVGAAREEIARLRRTVRVEICIVAFWIAMSALSYREENDNAGTVYVTAK
jgi:hypothetical protein